LKSCSLFHDITAIGLVSSHSSACHALTKYAGECVFHDYALHLPIDLCNTDFPIQSVDLSFCCQNAKAILTTSPVEYVKNMELRGSLFEDNCLSGAVSSAFTRFYVDHVEPLTTLAHYKAHGQWLLGDLLEGHEFLIILPILQEVGP
jgi:hypothetical protein